MYYKNIIFNENILQDNAERFFRGARGWFSLRKILSLETKHIIQIFDFAKPGSAIKNYARYTLGEDGWKEYMERNLQEMPAKTRRQAEYGTDAEQPFALFAELHQVNKNSLGVWAKTDKDATALYHRFENSAISLMEIQSRKNANQTLLFIALGKIPADGVTEENWEESVLVLRSNKPFNIQNHPDHLRAIEEIRNSAVAAYKERGEKTPITLTVPESLPIHKVARGNIYIEEESSLITDEIPEDVKQDSLKYLETAVSAAFSEAVLRELKTFNACQRNSSFDPQKYADLFVKKLETNASKNEIKDILQELNVGYTDQTQMLCTLMIRYFYDNVIFIKNQLNNPPEQTDDQIPALIILDQAREKIEPQKKIGDGNLYNGLSDFFNLIERKLKRAEEADIPSGSIVIAKNVSDSMLQMYIEKGAAGVIVLGDTTGTGHAVLKAKALNFPLIIGVSDEILNYLDRRDHDRPADRVVFYGKEIIINPHDAQITELEQKAEQNNPNFLLEKFHKRPVLLGEHEIRFKTNYFYEKDANLSAPISGEIGLLRDEMLPGESLEEMCAVFREVARCAPNGVTWRTLDVSRIDKLPESIDLPSYRDEQKTLLDYIQGTPEAFARIKLRVQAFFTVAREFPDTPFSIMYPMIFTEEDIAYYDNNFYQPAQAEYPESRVRKGVMIETSEAVENIDSILPQVEFISIGSNDLTMYVLHQNQRQETRQGLNQQVLKAIYQVLSAANEADKEVCVCGDMASNPVLAVILLALGKTNLSAGQNEESAVCKQACAYAIDNNLLPQIKTILMMSSSQNYVAEVYEEVKELFKQYAWLYEYICENY